MNEQERNDRRQFLTDALAGVATAVDALRAYRTHFTIDGLIHSTVYALDQARATLTTGIALLDTLMISQHAAEEGTVRPRRPRRPPAGRIMEARDVFQWPREDVPDNAERTPAEQENEPEREIE